MRPTSLLIIILVFSVNLASAGTFEPAPYIADEQVDVLSKNVANDMVGRELFGNPYATVVVGNVDVYDRFPFLEARYFQIVSDPSWNRLLMGEVGRNIVAFDGTGSEFGRLVSPRGMATDEHGRVYVADSGNNRVVVYRTVSEFDQLSLEPLFAIEGLSNPYDVAYSDGGTPFDGADDRLYVANTGRNEVRRYELTQNGAQLSGAIGELGSAMGSFAGPMALTVGHREGAHNEMVFVADAHNSRIVQLVDTGSSLAWAGSMSHQLGPVTSLDSDHWGNIYAASPHEGKVTKFTGELRELASFEGGIQRPRSFHVPFANVTDHRTGDVTRAGQGNGVLVEEWAGNNGMRLVNLGIDMNDATALKEERAAARITLTDHAAVTATLVDPRDGRVVARHDAGVLAAGEQTIRFDESDYLSAWDAGEYRMSVHAASTYDAGRVSETEMTVIMATSGSPALPNSLTSYGNAPNPFNPTTIIRFSVPTGGARPYSLRVYDVGGRLVRQLENGQISSGVHSVTWDGRNDNGESVGSGIYFYRVRAGSEKFTGKMVMVK